MTMLKIATHNSATGEKGRSILSYLVALFSICQSKSIEEQYNAGCRYFDLRIKYHKGEWVCAHGLWIAKKSLESILEELSNYGDCYASITYEGEEHPLFMSKVRIIHDSYNIKLTSINVKKPYWKCKMTYEVVPCNGEFLHLGGTSWHTLIPIPWLWKKIYYDKPKFYESYFTMVDFL